MSIQESGAAATRAAVGLRRAVQHVSNLWFPVNPDLLLRVRRSLNEGRYDLDVDFLIEDLRPDLALFTHCIRALSQMLANDFGPESAQRGTLSVRELFRVAGNDRIRKVLSQDANQISSHVPGAAATSQIQLIEDTMISASTAELLAEYRGLDSVDGFSAALLRQLGLTLISFNYPTAYRKALATVAEGKDLDTEISAQLGFSPQTLAAAIMQQWSPLSSTLRHTAAGDAALTPSEKASSNFNPESAQELSELCRVGEALVRASNPARHPTALADWNMAREMIESQIGIEGMQQIAVKVKAHCAQYMSMFPGQLERAAHFKPETAIHDFQQAKILDLNPLIVGCLDPLRIELQELYEAMNQKVEIRTLMQRLVTRVMIKAGFSGGCVYTFDPAVQALIPRLKFGRNVLRKNETLDLVTAQRNKDAVALAFVCAAPIAETPLEQNSDGELGIMVGSFGGANAIGVLYVEYPIAHLRELTGGALTHFRAVRQALIDCLGLHPRSN